MMTLQLEVGKTYRARNGDVVKIVLEVGDRRYRGDDCVTYPSNGRFLINEKESDLDLIEEVCDEFSGIFRAIYAAEIAEAEAMTRIRESLAELRAAVEAAQKAMRGEV